MTECDIKFLKYYGYNDYEIEHIEEIWNYKKDESYEMWKESFDAATKELQDKNKELHQKIIYLQNDKEDIIANWYCDKVGKCKIAELEKENAELKEELEYAKSHCLFHSDCPTQKENAKLKEELVEWNLIREDCETAFFRRDYLAMHKRVAKAKKIIRKLKALYFSPVVTNDDVKRQGEVLNEVEQFLNSEV